jgi:preprotein translocase subunit SecF
LICIIIYVSFRFQFGFALGGVVALAHDALITLGIFTICGNQVSLTTVAALLTIVGYSINDTIVIFDRIREEMARDEETPFPALVRKALNQTLSRTVLTTLSTLLAVCALYLFGGAAMHDFAFALFIGMIAGTYSTLFIAPAVMLAWYRNKRPRKVTLEAMASQE